MSRARLIRRIALALGAVLVCSACGSTGCQGCSPQPIPGGFPPEKRFDNAMQVRLSHTGLGFVEQHFSSLVTMLAPGGLSFTIPPTDCGASDQKICCSGPACSASIGIDTVKLTPTAPSTLKLGLRAQVQTSQIKYEKHVAVLGWFSCDVTYNSAKSAPATVGFDADVNLAVNPADHKLSISRGATMLSDFECGDIDVTGSWYCTVVDWLCPLFKGMIQNQLVGTVDGTLDGMLKSLPMGQEGRFDVASFLASFSPRTSGQLDYLLWGGGYAQAENAGLSFGVLGGFRAARPAASVPDCEKPGASCTPPALPAIARSDAFRIDSRPDGQPFDVGIGVHAKALEAAAYALYASGVLCVDVSTRSVPQLSSATFSLLAPSLGRLAGATALPMMVSVRPRNPPSIALGAGTYHTDPSGAVVIDDPLIKVSAKDFALDVYLELDERMVRLFTVVGQLELPVLLFADASGRLQPMLGALDQALGGIRVENSELLTEDPQALAQAMPTLIALAGRFVGSSFKPIELPSVQKLKLLLDGGSITSTDAGQVLAIFARLGLLETTKYGGAAPGPSIETEAAQEALWLPPAGAFKLGPVHRPDRAPRLTVRLGATVPAGLAGVPVEWAYRVDGGFYHPWTSAERVVIADPLFWLEGEHRVEVIARAKGRPETTDPEPVELRVLVAAERPAAKRTSAAAATVEEGGCSVGAGGGAGLGLMLLALVGAWLARPVKGRQF